MTTVTRVVATCDTVYPSWGPCLSTWWSDPERTHHLQVAHDLRKAKWLRVDGRDYCPLHHPLPGHPETGRALAPCGCTWDDVDELDHWERKHHRGATSPLIPPGVSTPVDPVNLGDA